MTQRRLAIGDVRIDGRNRRIAAAYLPNMDLVKEAGDHAGKRRLRGYCFWPIAVILFVAVHAVAFERVGSYHRSQIALYCDGARKIVPTCAKLGLVLS